MLRRFVDATDAIQRATQNVYAESPDVTIAQAAHKMEGSIAGELLGRALSEAAEILLEYEARIDAEAAQLLREMDQIDADALRRNRGQN